MEYKIEEEFKSTLEYIRKYEIFELEVMSNVDGFTSLRYYPKDEKHNIMQSFSGTINGVFNERMVMKEEDRKFPISTYSGDRELEVMESQITKISEAIPVIRGLEEVYNKDKKKLRNKILQKENTNKDKRGDLTIFQLDGKDAKKVFNQYFQHYFKGCKREMNNKQEITYIFNKKPLVKDELKVEGEQALFLQGKGLYGIKLNQYGIDVSDYIGRGEREVFRKGEHGLDTLTYLVNHVYQDLSPYDKKMLIKLLNGIYNGQVDRAVKSRLRSQV